MLEWADEAMRSFGHIILSVCPLLFAYEGARQWLATHKARPAIWWLAGGGFTAALVVGMNLFASSLIDRTIDLARPRMQVPQVAPDWGRKLSPEERERTSRALASAALKEELKVLKYVDVTGAWHEYCATPDDLRGIKEMAASVAELRAVGSTNQQAVWRFPLYLVLALLLGALVGHEERKKEIGRRERI